MDKVMETIQANPFIQRYVLMFLSLMLGIITCTLVG